MKWNKDKSLLLSKICLVVFAVGYAAVCCIAPWLNHIVWYTALIGNVQYIVITVYATAVPVFIAIWCLYKLLHNIGAGLVFVQPNVRYLRIVSWCCIGAAAIFFISMLYAWSFAILGVCAAFVGLILRVVKNVFAEAVSLKNENDLTI